jgi:formylglycine-generating enzyme required for sulfatase activity
LRGGSWSGVGRFCPSAYRGNNTPDYRSGNFGFRAVLTADPNAPVAPSISAHPQSQTVGAGTNVVFTVAATGSPPLTYQWRKDGVNLAGGGRISGATTTSLTIRLVQGADAGNYDVVVNNAVGSATSEGAVLATPNAPPDVPGMIWIPSGTFTMGSPATEQDRSGNEGPQTVVTLTKGFWMGRYEVTQAEYLSVMGSNPSSFTGDLNRPVERVNWYEATDYCGRLTAQERAAGRLPTGWAYRLPTEAEWEYAARAGTAARFSYGDDPGYTQLGNYAWYPANSGSQTHAVGQKQPNPWGLYDMAGNVWEWCLGWYATYPGGSVSDPVGPVSGSDRLLRGGSWGDGGARYCRSASRNNNTPDSRHLSIGFRAVLTADLNPPVPPSVSAHPQSRTVGAGTNVVFTVAATGTPPLTYQWRKGGVNLADGGRVNGVTTTNLTITSVQISDAGSYDVVVSNAAGSTNSQPATLAVSAFRFLVNGQPAQRRVVVLPSPTVEIQGPYSDWLVFYTLDDTLPSESNLLYQGAFTLDQAATVYPIAFAPDFSDQLLGDPLVVAFFSTQTIAVTPVSGLKYGDPAVTLQATASSGLPITWSLVSGPAQLQGSLLTPTGAGTVVVRASQAGSDVFAPAQASLTIDVARAPQTISWAQLPNRTFGDAAFAVGATASSGLPVAFELVSGPAQVTGTQVTLTGGGTVVLRARQDGNANYLAAQLDNSFTVAKAAQTLTFAALPDRVFSPNPIPLVASASSGLPITFAVLTGPATLAGGQLTLTGVGRVTVQASQPGNDSYLAAAASDRSFNVSQATQTLVFDAVPAKTYGDAPVALKATSNAGLTPVTYALVSGPGQLTGTQLTLLGAGVIVVQAQQAGDARYASAQAQLRIDVAQAAQTITFAALADMAYSTNRIPLAATASSGLPVVYTVVSGAAALADTNSLVLTTNVGPVQVRASQAGNSNYLAALSVTNTFTVSRGPQTIDFKAIGDQVLGVPPLTLVATASSGLPVSFELIGGPATLSAGKLTLLNEGAVTVRAVQVGSRLYLAAPPVEQTFQVRRMTLLLVAAGPGGKVTRNPDNADNLYTPGASVLLTATPDAGFAFAGWSGDTNTTQNPLTVIMNGSLSLSAGFRDAQSPQVSITRPATGATADERATLEGLITDNVGVTSARWERDGQGQGTLALVNGAFSVASLRLHRGDNLFRVIAADAAGNEGSASVVATWAPDRTLSAENPPEQREGKKLTVPLSLISQGDVGGMSFVLHYDADYLRDPWVEWSAVTGASANTVNSNTPGEVRATFSLAGLAVPPGTQLVASVTFRARSVPFDLLTDLSVELLDVSGPNSQTYLYGADTVDAQARILKRRMLGDNNANQRLDVGDATLIQRLLTHLDPVRAWDVSLNDLNANSALDSGDVTKVLRVVVGLDPQPGLLPLMPAEEELVTSEKAATTVLPLPGGEGRGEGEVSRLLIPTSQPSLRTRAVHPQSAGTTPSEAALLLPLLLTGKPGDLVKLEVALTNIQGQLAGAFFRLDYPIDALRLLNASSHTQGAMVPSGAALLWNVAPDQNNYVTQTGRVSFAASSASAWPSANGVLAELTFQVQPGASSQAGWPIRLSGVEVTADGFENRSLADALVMFGAAIQPPVIDVGRSGMGQDGFKLVIIGQPGSRYEVQFCDDLEHWTLLTTIVNVTGTVETVDPTLTPVFRRFYRVKQTSP